MMNFDSSNKRFQTVNETENFHASAAAKEINSVNHIDSQNRISTKNKLFQKNKTQEVVDPISNKASRIKEEIPSKKENFKDSNCSALPNFKSYNHKNNSSILKDERFDKDIDFIQKFDRSQLSNPFKCFDEKRKRDSGSDIVSEHEQNACSVMHNYSSLKKPDEFQPNQMKTKLRSMWNNMKYGWRVKREVNLKVDSAAWLLGRCYHNKLSESVTLPQDASIQLKCDIFSKIWLTYRINFPLIPRTDFTSDSGWGCMLRCSQMMMAQALICHFLTRDWRITPDQTDETKKLYKMILRWFGDSLSDASPFSLHQLVSIGEKYGRKAGNWYGPTHAAQILRDALNRSQKCHKQLQDVQMYVALDGIVFKQDIEDLCRGSPKNEVESTTTDRKEIIDFNEFEVFESSVENHLPSRMDFVGPEIKEFTEDSQCPSYSAYGPLSYNTAQNNWKSLILFVSVRLGNDKINPFYIPCIQNLFTYEHCIGIIGGRPKHALYFIGYQDDKIIHMDPHSCQPVVDLEREDFSGKTFHSASIRTMSFSEMDPSCAIGFYFKKENEFQHFLENISEIISPSKTNLDYPVFALAEGRRADVEKIDSSYLYTRSSLLNRNSISSKDEDDGYILL